MTRARCAIAPEPATPSGDGPGLADRFEAVRQAVITAERDTVALAAEVVAMREKVRSAHRVPADKFDVKHSVGGMVDVEFVMQYLVLAHSREHLELRDNTGNIKLLMRAESCGLLPAGMGEAAAQAYRQLRRIQHSARLDETTTQVDPERVQEEATAVRALWAHVLGSPGA